MRNSPNAELSFFPQRVTRLVVFLSFFVSSQQSVSQCTEHQMQPHRRSFLLVPLLFSLIVIGISAHSGLLFVIRTTRSPLPRPWLTYLYYITLYFIVLHSSCSNNGRIKERLPNEITIIIEQRNNITTVLFLELNWFNQRNATQF